MNPARHQALLKPGLVARNDALNATARSPKIGPGPLVPVPGVSPGGTGNSGHQCLYAARYVRIIAVSGRGGCWIEPPLMENRCRT